MLWVLAVSISLWLTGAPSHAQNQAVTTSPDGRVRLVRDHSDAPSGKLYAKSAGNSKIVAYDVTRFWLSKDNQTVLYAVSDRMGRGFENEGQTLIRYEMDSGRKKILYMSQAYITNVAPTKTRSGKNIVLVTSKDSALGAPTAALVDPEKGAIWERKFARFGTAAGGVVSLTTYPAGEPATGDFDTAKPAKVEKLDLDKVIAGKYVAPAALSGQKPVSPAGSAKVTGTVTYRERMALPPDAVIEVTLADVSLADAPAKTLGKQMMKANGKQAPFPFSISYEPKTIIPNHTYAVSARITIAGKLTFINDTRYAVLTNKAPSKVDLVLIRVPASPLAAGSRPAENAGIPALAPDIISGKLNNGLTYYIRRNSYPAQKAEMRLVVNAGSILESEEQRGLAHFLEHMMFNGTPGYPKNELVNYLQGLGIRFGADLNAYTSFDETVYILPVPTTEPANFDKGLEILKEWAGEATLDADEINRERGVVLSELRDGKSAQERLRKQYFPRVLNGSRYAERIPIGDEDVLKNFTPDKVRSFYKQWYRPDLQAIIVVGDVDVQATKKKIQELFGQLKMPDNPTPRPTITPIAEREKAEAMILTDKELPASQTLTIQYFRRRQPVTNVAAYRASLVDQLFNQMMNARLYEVGQRPDRPFLFGQASRGGFLRGYEALTIVGGTSGDPVKTATVLTTEVERVRRFGFTEAELARAKAEVLQNYEQSAKEKDKIESSRLAEELITHHLEGDAAPGVVWEYDFVRKALPAISVSDINGQKGRLTSDPRVRPFSMILAPGATKTPLPSESQLLASLNNARTAKVTPYAETVTAKTLLPNAPIPGQITKTTVNQRDGATTYAFSNGVTVTVKATDFKNDQILLGGTRYGGSLLYNVPDLPSAQFATGIVGAMGYGAFNPTQLNRLLTGRNANASLSITPYYDSVNGASNVKDFETMLQLLYLKMTAPRKDEALFKAEIAQTRSYVATQRNNPDVFFQASLYDLLAGGNPYATRTPTTADVDKVSLTRSLQIHQERFGNAYGYQFYIVGSIKPETVKPLLAKYLGGLPSRPIKPAFKDRNVRAPKGKLEKTVRKGTEDKANIMVMYRNEVPFTPQDDLRMEALSYILENKTIEKIREDMGSAYSPYAGGDLRRVPIGNSIVQFVIGATPAQVPAVEKAVAEISADLRENGPTDADMAKMKATFRQKNRVDLRTNEYWLARFLSGYADPATAEAAATYAQRSEALNATEIKSAAQKYMNPSNVIQMVMLPGK